MAGILDFLQGDNLQKLVSGLSEKTGISSDKVTSVMDSVKSMFGGEGDAASAISKLTSGDAVKTISEKSGVSLDSVSKIFENFTPMVSQFFSGKGGNISEMFTSFLDKNKDGNVMDDIKNGISGLFRGK